MAQNCYLVFLLNFTLIIKKSLVEISTIIMVPFCWESNGTVAEDIQYEYQIIPILKQTD